MNDEEAWAEMLESIRFEEVMYAPDETLQAQITKLEDILSNEGLDLYFGDQMGVAPVDSFTMKLLVEGMQQLLKTKREERGD